jgi:sulfoquinovosyltransferase
MKIMILSDPSPITYMSGQSMRFRTLLEHIVHMFPHDRVHLVTCDTNNSDPPTSCYDRKVPIFYTRGFRLPQYKALSVSFDWTARVLRLSGKYDYDLIHVSSPGGLVVPAILASRLRGIPLVMSYHTHLPAYVRIYFASPWNKVLEWIAWRIIQSTHSWADLTVVTSPQMGDELQQHGIPNVIWPKGVNTTQFHPRFQSQKMKSRMMDGKSDAFLLVYIGRLAKEKRLLHLKPMLEKLQDRSIPVHLCIVGEGPEAEDLQSHFRGTPTTFLGSLTGVPLSQAFASGDVFVMPSDSETLGFVVMESMASGVPVVASKTGGLIDLIRDGETGFLVPPDDTDAFVTRIETLHRNRDLRMAMSKSGRALAEEWSWGASMDFLRLSAYSQAKDCFSNRLSQHVSMWWSRARDQFCGRSTESKRRR